MGCFYNNGIIAENQKHEQGKLIKYQHLVANMVILYNAEKLSRALEQVKADGFPLEKSHMLHLSPYWTSHINRLGQYILNASREVKPMNYELNVFR